MEAHEVARGAPSDSYQRCCHCSSVEGLSLFPHSSQSQLGRSVARGCKYSRASKKAQSSKAPHRERQDREATEGLVTKAKGVCNRNLFCPADLPKQRSNEGRIGMKQEGEKCFQNNKNDSSWGDANVCQPADAIPWEEGVDLGVGDSCQHKQGKRPNFICGHRLSEIGFPVTDELEELEADEGSKSCTPGWAFCPAGRDDLLPFGHLSLAPHPCPCVVLGRAGQCAQSPQSLWPPQPLSKLPSMSTSCHGQQQVHPAEAGPGMANP